MMQEHMCAQDYSVDGAMPINFQPIGHAGNEEEMAETVFISGPRPANTATAVYMYMSLRRDDSESQKELYIRCNMKPTDRLNPPEAGKGLFS